MNLNRPEVSGWPRIRRTTPMRALSLADFVGMLQADTRAQSYCASRSSFLNLKHTSYNTKPKEETKTATGLGPRQSRAGSDGSELLCCNLAFHHHLGGGYIYSSTRYLSVVPYQCRRLRSALLDGVCRVRNSHRKSFISHRDVCNTKTLEKIKLEG